MRNCAVLKVMPTELKWFHWRKLLKIAKIIWVALLLTVYLWFLFPKKTNAFRICPANFACENSSADDKDVFKTLGALDFKIDDYWIGVNDTAKIFSA